MNTSISITRRNRIAFPVVGQIRTGDKKVAVQGDNSKTRPGKDLGLKFRVEFKPGNEDAKQAFLDTYGTLYPERIFSVLCFPEIEQHWSVFLEAYTAGRMVAQANADHYITLIDPSTWDYIVKDGEPRKPFHPGDTVTYTRNIKGEERRFSLPIKPSGRLRLWLPDIKGRMVMFELKTTSFYSCVNIAEQLATIHQMAWGRGKSLSGIPIWIYRIPTEIPYLDPKDNIYKRVIKHLINIEVDPSYMQALMGAAQQWALDFSSAKPPSLPEGPVVIDEVATEEQLDDHDPEEGDASQDAEKDAGDAGTQAEQPPAMDDSNPQPALQNPSPAESPVTEQPKPEPQPEPPAPPAKVSRPYEPMQLRARLAEIAGQIKEGALNGGTWTREKVGISINVLEAALSAIAPDVRVARGDVTDFLIAYRALDSVTAHWGLALYAWLSPTQDDGGEWKCKGVVNAEIIAVFNHIQELAQGADPIAF